MTDWIWQQEHWPAFYFEQPRVLPILEATVQAVAPLKHLAATLSEQQRLNWEAAVLLDETLSSAQIEGEVFDRESVRSSIADKLGIAGPGKFNRHADSVIELMLRAVRFSDKLVDHQTLKGWHQLLFPVQPLLGEMTIGDYRDETMQVVSGRYGKQQIHYIAPGDCYAAVNGQMCRFVDWLNGTPQGSMYIRAAIAKFWFVTIHPFDDGNGRLSRIIAERCLAEAEQTELRLYAISSIFEQQRKDYYQQLENAQRGNLDITGWICWFLECVQAAAQASKHEFSKVMHTTRFWQVHYQTPFNDRQRKLLKRLLETGDFAQGISRKKYKSLAKTSDATALRDLTDLVDKQVLETIGEGRGRRYVLVML